MKRLTRASLAEAVRYLAMRDPGLARIVQHHGVPPLWARPTGFATLVRIILEQQVSLASAATLYARITREIPGGITPPSIMETGIDGLRSVGLTRQKSAYLHALSARVVDGRLSLTSLNRASDAEVLQQLRSVPGIGPWSASIYMLMAMRRPDVWPPGDLALHKSLARLHQLATPPTNIDAMRMAEGWAPFRSVAARILWLSYLAEQSARRAENVRNRRIPSN